MKKILLFLTLSILSFTAIAQIPIAQQVTMQQYSAVTGTDTYATTSTGIKSYTTGVELHVKFANANTGAATINVNALGAKALKKNASDALAANDIVVGKIYTITYDGTNFQMGTLATSGTVTSVSVTTVNGVSGTVATATTTPAISLTLGAITPTTVTPTGQILGAAGTATLPSYSFSGDPNTGVFSSSGNLIGIATDGVERFNFSTSTFSPTVNNSYDIGNGSVNFRDINLSRAVDLYGSASGDIDIVATATADGVVIGNLTVTNPGSAATVTVTGGATLSVPSNATVSGTNTGDQTNITGNAATVTTNANLTGAVTSVGNAASLGSFTLAALNTALSDADVATGGGTATGTNTGDITLAAVGGTPNANGASLTGQALNLQPADATNPGIVTTGAQTFGGTKTFVAPILGVASATSISTTLGVNGVYDFVKEISSAELLALFTTEIEVIAAPAAGQMITLLDIELFYDYGGTAYTLGAANRLEFRYDTKTGELAVHNTFVSGLLDQTVDIVQTLQQNTLFQVAASGVIAKKVVLFLSGGNMTLGNGTLHIRGQYKIVSSGL